MRFYNTLHDWEQEFTKKVKKIKNFWKKYILAVDTFFTEVYIHIHRRTTQVRHNKAKKFFDRSGKERKTKIRFVPVQFLAIETDEKQTEPTAVLILKIMNCQQFLKMIKSWKGLL